MWSWHSSPRSENAGLLLHSGIVRYHRKLNVLRPRQQSNESAVLNFSDSRVARSGSRSHDRVTVCRGRVSDIRLPPSPLKPAQALKHGHHRASDTCPFPFLLSYPAWSLQPHFVLYIFRIATGSHVLFMLTI